MRGIMFSTHGVGDHRENSVAQRRHIVDLWHLAALMDGGCGGVCGEGLGEGGSLVNIMFFM